MKSFLDVRLPERLPHAEAAERKARTGTETERSFGKVIFVVVVDVIVCCCRCLLLSLFVVVVVCCCRCLLLSLLLFGMFRSQLPLLLPRPL
jgi:hypothetical protein